MNRLRDMPDIMMMKKARKNGNYESKYLNNRRTERK